MKLTPKNLLAAMRLFATQLLWPFIRRPRRYLSSSHPEQPVYVFLLVMIVLLFAPLVAIGVLFALGHHLTRDWVLRMAAAFFGVLWGLVLMAWWIFREGGPFDGGESVDGGGGVTDDEPLVPGAPAPPKLRVVDKKRDAA